VSKPKTKVRVVTQRPVIESSHQKSESAEIAISTVDTGDRLSFTIFVAIALHALVILGIGFQLPKPSNTSQTFDITLATHQDPLTPEEVDFLAQHNQEASGTIDQAKQLTTDKQAQFADAQIRKVNPIPQQQKASDKHNKQQVIVTTTAKSAQTINEQKNPDPKKTEDKIKGAKEDQPLQIDDLASLQAKLDRQRQEYAKRPRIRTLTSVSTKASYDAKYLHEWSTKIEQVGHKNYPQEALNRRITGQLRLSVTINPNGSVYEVKILQSSGKRLLDDAAKQIVRLASPYAPFPAEIRQHADRLQIIRTWNFEITGKETSITTSAN
jgi:periplasmic protein TonB